MLLTEQRRTKEGNAEALNILLFCTGLSKAMREPAELLRLHWQVLASI